MEGPYERRAHAINLRSQFFSIFSALVVNTFALCTKGPCWRLGGDKPSLMKSQVSVLLVLLPDLDKPKGCTREGIHCKNSAKSNMHIHALLVKYRSIQMYQPTPLA